MAVCASIFDLLDGVNLAQCLDMSPKTALRVPQRLGKLGPLGQDVEGGSAALGGTWDHDGGGGASGNGGLDAGALGQVSVLAVDGGILVVGGDREEQPAVGIPFEGHGLVGAAEVG